MTANGIHVFVVREDNLEGEQTRSLLALHLAELHANSPPGAVSLKQAAALPLSPPSRCTGAGDLWTEQRSPTTGKTISVNFSICAFKISTPADQRSSRAE